MTATEPLQAPGDAETSPVVVRDVFPVEVVIAGELYRSARALLTRERVYVWTDGGGQPLLVLSAPYEHETAEVPSFQAPRAQPTRVTLDDGRYVAINRQRGCGCGSPLKNWRPVAPYVTGAR